MTGKAGAKVKYPWKPEYAEQCKNLALLGATETEMATFFGVSHSTFQRWKKSHPEMGDHLAFGKIGADGKVALSLYRRAVGFTQQEVDLRVIAGEVVQTVYTKKYAPDTTACIFYLKNRRPDLWSNRTESEASPVERQLKAFEAALKEIELERAKFLLDELKAAKTDVENNDDQDEFLRAIAAKLPN